MKRLNIVIIFISILILSSCTENHFKVDVSDVKADVKIERFDKELQNFNLNNADSLIKVFEKKYGFFFEIFNRYILQVPLTQTTIYADNLYNFIKYNKNEKIFEITDKIFDKSQSKGINELFKHYKYYFPKDTLPTVVIFVSGFNQSVITTDKHIAIALDKYLGSDSKFYKGVDNYIRKRMDKSYILVDVAAAIAEAKYPAKNQAPNMFEKLMYEGKKQYFINSMLPDVPDTLKFIYSQRQLNWANKNEKNIWNHLQENSLLFSNDRFKIKQYTDIAPFTIPLSDISAPRAANFVGYKIVLEYMKNNPDVSLKQLMENNNYQAILADAQYQP